MLTKDSTSEHALSFTISEEELNRREMNNEYVYRGSIYTHDISELPLSRLISDRSDVLPYIKEKNASFTCILLSVREYSSIHQSSLFLYSPQDENRGMRERERTKRKKLNVSFNKFLFPL